MALYHSDKGSVNYTIVGSPTIVDGVVSGFSDSNYLLINNEITASNPLEIYFDFTTGPSLTGNQELSALLRSGRGFSSRIFIQGNNSLIIYGYDTGYLAFSYSFSTETRYKLKIEYDGDKTIIATLYSATDVQLKTETFTLTYALPAIAYIYIGTVGTTSSVWGGSIDLNETYISINGQAWFGVCPVEVKHIDYGTSVGYTKVGSPTISNGILTNLSLSNYLSLNQSLTYDGNSDLEFYSRFKLPSEVTGAMMSIGQGYGYQDAYADGFLMVTKTGNLVYPVGIAGHGISGGTVEFYSYNMTPGLWYRQKLTAKNGVWTMSLYDDSGNLLGSANKTVAFETKTVNLYIGRPVKTGNTFFDAIDLNSTYIKVNGKLWFFRPSTNYLVKDDKLVFADSGLYLSGPVNYTKVGTPTIVDGVASGFSASNYLTTSQAVLNSSAQIIEEQLSFTTGTVGTQQMPMGGNYGAGNLGFEISPNSNNNKILYRVTYKDESNVTKYGEVVANYELVQNTKYIARGILDCDAKSMSITLLNANGTVLTNASKILSSFYSLDSVGNMFLGSHWQRGVFSGSIDLNNTYIKVSGKLWFYGKNYASQNIAPVPAGYTYGNTTTSAIGYVDMRTQVFTPAPSGATLGKDEVSEES